MSDVAILTAIPEILIDSFDEWTINNCKAMPDERPDPVANELFASVYISEIQNNLLQNDAEMQELWSFAITVTKRIHAVPYDRLMPSVYLEQIKGLYPAINRITNAINNRYSVINRINAKIPKDPQLNNLVLSEAFVTPVYALNRTPKVTLRNEEWFHGSHGTPARDRNDGHVGMSMTVFFGNLIKQTTLVPETCEQLNEDIH